MPTTISQHRNHILVEPSSGINYWEIYEAVFRVSPAGGFPDMDQIWLFRHGPLQIVFDDLFQLKEAIAANYPKGRPGKKIAIVIDCGLHLGVATAFSRIATDLPCDIRVFPNLHSAAQWVGEAAPLQPHAAHIAPPSAAP